MLNIGLSKSLTLFVWVEMEWRRVYWKLCWGKERCWTSGRVDTRINFISPEDHDCDLPSCDYLNLSYGMYSLTMPHFEWLLKMYTPYGCKFFSCECVHVDHLYVSSNPSPSSPLSYHILPSSSDHNQSSFSTYPWPSPRCPTTHLTSKLPHNTKRFQYVHFFFKNLSILLPTYRHTVVLLLVQRPILNEHDWRTHPQLTPLLPANPPLLPVRSIPPAIHPISLEYAIPVRLALHWRSDLQRSPTSSANYTPTPSSSLNGRLSLGEAHYTVKSAIPSPSLYVHSAAKWAIRATSSPRESRQFRTEGAEVVMDTRLPLASLRMMDDISSDLLLYQLLWFAI